MEEKDDAKLLLAHWRNETIHWGNVFVALMDRLDGLNIEEKFRHLAIERIVQDLMNEVGDTNHPVPKEITDIVEKGDQVEIKQEAQKAERNFSKANENRAWFKSQIRRREYSSQSI